MDKKHTIMEYIRMEKDYIAGVGENKVSQQNLLILMGKYHLTEDKMEEIKEYCYHHGIII